DLTFLKGLNLGGTWLQIFDHKKSYKGDDTVFQETAAQKTAILSLRPGIDIGKTFGLPSLLELDISAEVAFSIDDTVAFDSEKKEFIYPDNIMGKAINVKGTLGLEPGAAFGLKLN